MAERLSAALTTVEVLDRAGCPFVLPSLWAEQPIVLAPVRHFG
ncbi:MAG: hypothetical protein QF664_04915 [Dehalococcoidia bacterium]|jgi:hypothetical protein|nr:hypothetical protein [Dehalococcoidia bacterium]